MRQADALARALGLDARALVLQPVLPARWCAPRLFPGAARALGADFANALAQPPTLAIGCGRQAALATRVLRTRGARAVQILDPRIDPRHWDVVIAPEHDGLRGANVVTLLGSLHPVDDAWLAQARTRFATFGEWPSPRTALLVGGDSAHARLDADALQALLVTVGTALAREGGSLLLTTSRRTAPAHVDALRAFAACWPGVAWFANDGMREGITTNAHAHANPYPGLLAWADRIVCTADSVNMLSEACATHAPVFVSAPERVQGRPRHFLDALLARGRIRALDARMAPFDVQPLRETARVAADVRARLALG